LRPVSRAYLIVLLGLFFTTSKVYGDDTISLFNVNGQAEAYITPDKTIYLWSGKPLAYLYSDHHRAGESIYGFNGKYLGWFEQGLARDRKGDKTCGIKNTVRSTRLESLKSLKELKPLKALRELPPIRPLIHNRWSDTSCSVFLSRGR
jgi:hypothetical protein